MLYILYTLYMTKVFVQPSVAFRIIKIHVIGQFPRTGVWKVMRLLALRVSSNSAFD